MIVALNNKSNLGKDDFLGYQEGLAEIETKHTLIVCPTHMNINLYKLEFPLGAQNVSCFDEGAHTGEISAQHLANSYVEYCIVGHSERRQEERETLEDINRKIKKLQEVGITPILCVGETKEEREKHQYKEIVKKEIETAIRDNDKENIIIAYEPIWSIGTGIIPTNDEIKEMFQFIKTILPKNKILYGGSANEKNIDTLKQIHYIDGYLVGGLSLNIDSLKVFLNKLN